MKKAVALLMVLTMSVTALAGCSGGESSKKDEEKSSFKEQAKGEKDLSGKVVYWSMYNEGEPKQQRYRRQQKCLWKIIQNAK